MFNIAVANSKDAGVFSKTIFDAIFTVGGFDGGRGRGSVMSASDVILNQIANDFEELARLAERAVQAHRQDDPKAEGLRRVRAMAFDGATLARQLLTK